MSSVPRVLGRPAALSVLLLLGVAAPAQAADACPNAALRTGPSATLPECRAYEQVSPADKNGYPVFFYRQMSLGATDVAPDGESAIYGSYGAFAGAVSGMPIEYRSRRTPSGWATQPLTPAPVTPEPQAFTDPATWIFASTDLTVGALTTTDYFDPTDVNDATDVYTQRDDQHPQLVSRGNGAERTSSGQASAFDGMSADGSHIAFSTFGHLSAADSGRLDGSDSYVRSAGHTQPLNVHTDGTPISPCGSTLGTGPNGDTRMATAISHDGSRIVFQVPAKDAFGDVSCYEPRQVYVRDGDVTLHASASRRTTPDPNGSRPASFRGASADGSIVVFASEEMLTDDAPPGGGLYRFRPASDTLEFLGDTNDSGVAVGGFVGLSADGTHLYFVSRRQIDGHGTDGVSNLYVQSGATTRLVTTEDGTDSLIGDLANPDETAPRLSMTPDGKYLVFASSARLSDFPTRTDPFGGLPFRHVYLYAEGQDGVVCVSCDPAGQRPPGSSSNSNAGVSDRDSRAPLLERVMADDGHAVFFTSGDQLTSADTNAQRDVYEYSDGRVHLISGGKGTAESRLVGSSSDGRSVFFTTVDALVEGDEDGGNQDLYVARVDGGFPSSATRVAPPCTDDQCQPAPKPPVVPEAAVTLERGDPGYVTALPRPVVSKTPTVRGVSAVLRIRLATAGKVVVSGAGLGTVKKTVRGPGRVAVRVTLTKKARSSLRQRRTVRLTPRVTFTSADGRTTSVRAVLTFKATSSTKERS